MGIKADGSQIVAAVVDAVDEIETANSEIEAQEAETAAIIDNAAAAVEAADKRAEEIAEAAMAALAQQEMSNRLSNVEQEQAKCRASIEDLLTLCQTLQMSVTELSLSIRPPQSPPPLETAPEIPPMAEQPMPMSPEMVLASVESTPAAPEPAKRRRMFR